MYGNGVTIGITGMLIHVIPTVNYWKTQWVRPIVLILLFQIQRKKQCVEVHSFAMIHTVPVIEWQPE
jgi:hypothetical protein